MKRCPDCAETVQSAARICRHCHHEFAGTDDFGQLSDAGNAAVRWIFKLIGALILFYLAYAFISGAAMDQQDRERSATQH